MDQLAAGSTDWIAIAAIATASTALAITAYQIFTRHRPFIGIVDIAFDIDPERSYMNLELKNWGDIQSNEVTAELTFPGYPNTSEPRMKTFGTILPGERLRSYWPLPAGAPNDLYLDIGVFVETTIRYRAPGSFGWPEKGRGFGFHAITLRRWGGLEGWSIEPGDLPTSSLGCNNSAGNVARGR